eukprot:Gregarina_sp_Poly_1__7842@NODE_444_length_8342_cov_78_805438_g362_i0_p1_GENE_NODE_444_length_8342_cov_78_805438_g362_i0NODE_444_length_8342_cov_78_805438_g362_i0_p1_ORF_typecomplete_len996_score190_886PGD/PF00393_19/0_16DUF4660/PF15559_6/0_33_NODE_444_length_8342_cov_78_805438_g362_i0322989
MDDDTIGVVSSNLYEVFFEQVPAESWNQILSVPDVRLRSSDLDDAFGCRLTLRQLSLLAALFGLQKQLLLNDCISAVGAKIFNLSLEVDPEGAEDYAIDSPGAVSHKFKGRWFPSWQSEDMHQLTSAILRGLAYELWKQSGDVKFCQFFLIDVSLQRYDVELLQTDRESLQASLICETLIPLESDNIFTFIQAIITEKQLLKSSQALAVVLNNRPLVCVLVELILRKFSVCRDAESIPVRSIENDFQVAAAALLKSLPASLRFAVKKESQSLAQIITTATQSTVPADELSQSLVNSWMCGIASVQMPKQLDQSISDAFKTSTTLQNPQALFDISLRRPAYFKDQGKPSREWHRFKKRRSEEAPNITTVANSQSLTRSLWEFALRNAPFARMLLTSLICCSPATAVGKSLGSFVIRIVDLVLESQSTSHILNRSEEQALYMWMLELLAHDTRILGSMLEKEREKDLVLFFYKLFQIQNRINTADPEVLKFVFETALVMTSSLETHDEGDSEASVEVRVEPTTRTFSDLQIQLCSFNWLLSTQDSDVVMWKTATEICYGQTSEVDDIEELFGVDQAADWHRCLAAIERAKVEEQTGNFTQASKIYANLSVAESPKLRTQRLPHAWLSEVSSTAIAENKLANEICQLHKTIYDEFMVKSEVSGLSLEQAPLLEFATQASIRFLDSAPSGVPLVDEVGVSTLFPPSSNREWIKWAPHLVVDQLCQRKFERVAQIEERSAKAFLALLDSSSHWIDLVFRSAVSLFSPEKVGCKMPIATLAKRRPKFNSLLQYRELAAIGILKNVPNISTELLNLMDRFDISVAELDKNFSAHFEVYEKEKLEWISLKQKIVRELKSSDFTLSSEARFLEVLKPFSAKSQYSLEVNEVQEKIHLGRLEKMAVDSSGVEEFERLIAADGGYPSLLMRFMELHYEAENVNANLVIKHFLYGLESLNFYYSEWAAPGASVTGLFVQFSTEDYRPRSLRWLQPWM